MKRDGAINLIKLIMLFVMDNLTAAFYINTLTIPSFLSAQVRFWTRGLWTIPSWNCIVAVSIHISVGEYSRDSKVFCNWRALVLSIVVEHFDADFNHKISSYIRIKWTLLDWMLIRWKMRCWENTSCNSEMKKEKYQKLCAIG